MFKANAAILWEARSTQRLISASTASTFGRLMADGLDKAKQILRYFSGTNLLKTLINYRECKVGAMEQQIKDSFFFDRDLSDYVYGGLGDIGRGKIPTKTWKRHSALLVYRQQLKNHQLEYDLETGLKLSLDYFDKSFNNSSGPANLHKRLSFHVKSIRYLPVWATALGEIGLIETDLSISALRTMNVHKLTDITAEAA